MCEGLGGEDAEKVPFRRGEVSGEVAVGQGLGDHRSSIREGDRRFYQSGSSTLRSRFGKLLPLEDSWNVMTDGNW